MIRKYRKKPVVIEAVVWTGKNKYEVFEFLGAEIAEGQAISMTGKNFFMDYSKEEPVLKIKTLEGNMDVKVGDHIIKGIKGEFYPCDPEIFEMTYERVQS